MAVQFYNGQYYDVLDPKIGAIGANYDPSYSLVGNLGLAKALSPPVTSSAGMATQGAGMYSDPFGTAMSGGKSGTLQPYVNRMNQNASNALYGGLLNYKPQQMFAGDAGGTPVHAAAPQGFNIQSALRQQMPMQGQMQGQPMMGQPTNGLTFGNRSWMQQGGGNG